MRFMGAIIGFAVLTLSTTANAQETSFQDRPLNLHTYSKVSLNTGFQVNLKEIENGQIAQAKVNPGLGFSAAFGVDAATDFNAEIELVSYRGTVDFRTVDGVATAYVPNEDVTLNALMMNGYYKFDPVNHARFKLGGGLGYSQYILTDTNSARHRGQGLVYQIKAVGEYDLAPTVGFLFEGGYLGTSNIDVDLSASTVSRVSALRGLTFGTGLKSRF